jgi:hypothetical protein
VKNKVYLEAMPMLVSYSVLSVSEINLLTTIKEELYESGKDVMLMIQADMLAYHSADEPLQLGIPEM